MVSQHPPRATRDEAPAAPLSVYLVDDHVPYRECLKGLLAADPGLRIVGEAGAATQALAEAVRRAPAPLADVVLLDVAMPGINGVTLARRLCELAPASRLLALSMHDDASVVAAMLAAGASGYLVKSDPLPEVLLALRAVAGGGSYLSAALEPGLRQRLLAGRPATPDGRQPPS